MKLVVLTGGVGGAKLVLGCQELGAELTAIVNTGDDFCHLGLPISPDIDTLMYTLSGKANRMQGWGREGESWQFMEAMQSLGGPTWFQLGDADLALHLWRRERLAQVPLSTFTSEVADSWGIKASILPMTDSAVSTMLDTDEGLLAFQEYFVGRRCEPKVSAIRFEGAENARPAPGVAEAIIGADAILIAPSNPWLSVDPILAVPGIRRALQKTPAPIVCISPLIGGKAVKGPTSKLMDELGIQSGNDGIAAHYAGVIDAMLHDTHDTAPNDLLTEGVPTLMHTLEDKVRVAKAALALAAKVRR